MIPSAPTLPAAPETTEPTDPQQAAAPFTATRIHITARLDTWIKIIDHNGRSVFNRVLNAGEGYDVPDEAGLKMITGNAGGMDILVDGAAIAPPGRARQGAPGRGVGPGKAQGGNRDTSIAWPPLLDIGSRLGNLLFKYP